MGCLALTEYEGSLNLRKSEVQPSVSRRRNASFGDRLRVQRRCLHLESCMFFQFVGVA